MTAAAFRPATNDRHDPSPETGEVRAGALLDLLASLPANSPSRPTARSAAIEAWLPTARRLARRFAQRGVPLEDLTQVAAIGLINAVDRFDPRRGTPFAGYAIPTIIGEIKRHFRDRTWAVRVPRRLQDLRLAISAANNTLANGLGRAPTVADVAAHLGITEEEVIEGLEGARAYQTTPLSSPSSGSRGIELGDTIGVIDPGFEATELRLTLRPALSALNQRDQHIVALRFYGNRTQTQIASELGLSQMHVSRLLTRALARLRASMDQDR